MGSLGNSKPWPAVPYINTKDCSQGFCSWHCPQWCYINFPPPPPPLQFPDDDEYGSSSNFSPLVIALIGILASAFLLVSYYIIISKFCQNSTPRSVIDNSEPPSEFPEEIQDSMVHFPWHVVSTGLDEALIKSIAVCKYKKGDGLVEGTECSVCLTEFRDDESLRLLPKCSHAFHVDCIDTWLKSHSNCPLCRALILSPGSSLPPPTPPLVPTDPPPHNPEMELETETCVDQEEGNPRPISFQKNSVRALSDLGGVERLESIIEIRDEEEKQKRVRRSMSMDYLCQSRVPIAGVLRSEQDCDETDQTTKRQRVLHLVMGPLAVKRSFSRGGFLCVGHGKGQNAIIPF